MLSYLLAFGFGYYLRNYDIMQLTRHLTTKCDTFLHYVVSLTPSTPLDDYLQECETMLEVERRHKMVMVELVKKHKKEVQPVETDKGWWFW